MLRRRKQCGKCPWKVGTNAREIPNGYCESKHRDLNRTIAGLSSAFGTLRLMACHESKVGEEKPCVGWLHNQLGEGNNIGLRLAVFRGQISADYQLAGAQHANLEATFPTDEA